MKTLLLSVALMLLLSACNPQEPVPFPLIANWGQRSTPAGVPFNVQADGNSGIYFEFYQHAAPGDVVVTMGGKPLTGAAVSGAMVTATIPPEYLAEPGRYPVVVELQPAGTRVQAGDFEVVQP
jgi:hypothetical protein